MQGCFTDWGLVTSGVLQGLMVGSLLFVIWMRMFKGDKEGFWHAGRH